MDLMVPEIQSGKLVWFQTQKNSKTWRDMLGMTGFGEIVNDEKLFELQEMQPNRLI